MHRRGVVWTERKLLYILKKLGEPGIVAALNAKTVKRAAQNITAIDGYQTPLLMKTLWSRPELASLWIRVCGQNSVNILKLFHLDSPARAWDAVVGHCDPDIQRAIQRYEATRRGVGGKPAPIDLATHIILSTNHKRSKMFEAVIQTRDIGVLLEPKSEMWGRGRKDDPALNVLILSTPLIGQRRVIAILKVIENDPTLLKKVSPLLFNLAQCAIESNASSVLEKVLSWSEGNSIRRAGCDESLLERGLLLPNKAGDWKGRWDVLNMVGASDAQLLADALSSEVVWDGLMEHARQLGNTHCFNILHQCALAGVDLLKIKKDGLDIVMAAKQSQEDAASNALALVEQHVLSNATTCVAAAPHQRRRI